MQKKILGMTHDGQNITAYTLSFGVNGMEMTVMDYGAALLSLYAIAKRPEEQLTGNTFHERRDVVLGFADIKKYFKNGECFGVVVGPNANRVGDARFEFNGVEYTLDKNDNDRNNNHSGMTGWNKMLWDMVGFQDDKDEKRITFSHKCEKGECHFPGCLEVQVTYTLGRDYLAIDYYGKADEDSVFNPTNHSYFNLKGHGVGDIEDHNLTVYANQFLPGGEWSVPDGTMRDVEDTPFDFRTETPIGERIRMGYDELKYGKGYDHCFVLDRNPDAVSAQYSDDDVTVYPAAVLSDRERTLFMSVYTSSPGMMVYTGNYLGGEIGMGGCVYPVRGGIALETQYFPNALNVDSFEKPYIMKGETKHFRTVFAFSNHTMEDR